MIQISIRRLSRECRRALPVWSRLLARTYLDLRTRWAAFQRGHLPHPKSRHLVPELSVRELKAILTAARRLGGPYGSGDGVLLEAAAASKRLRVGELLALRWGDIDWTSATFCVERVLREGALEAPKCGRARDVRLAPHTRRSLLRHRASLARRGPEDLVFPDPTEGSFLDVRCLGRRFQAVLRRTAFPAMALSQLSLAFKAPWWSRYL